MPTSGGDYTQDFEALWAIHRRGGKRAAFRAFQKAIPAKLSLEEAQAALRSYVSHLDGFSGAHLSTWLNQEYWHQEAHQEVGEEEDLSHWGDL